MRTFRCPARVPYLRATLPAHTMEDEEEVRFADIYRGSVEYLFEEPDGDRFPRVVSVLFELLHHDAADAVDELADLRGEPFLGRLLDRMATSARAKECDLWDEDYRSIKSDGWDGPPHTEYYRLGYNALRRVFDRVVAEHKANTGPEPAWDLWCKSVYAEGYPHLAWDVARAMARHDAVPMLDRIGIQMDARPVDLRGGTAKNANA